MNLNPITKDVEVGFNANHGIATVSAKQYDTNRKLRCQLVDDEISYIANDVNYLYFRERFSNGQILLPVELEDAVFSADRSEVTFSLTSNMLMIPGMAYCELVFINGTGIPEFDDKGHLINDDWTILSTQAFQLYIEPTVYEDDCAGGVAKEYQDILIQLVIAAQNIIKDYEEFKQKEAEWEENEETRISNENTRISNENTRISNENTRISSESSRVSAENIRVASENKRAAIEFGGTYVDEHGDTQTVTNNYVDPDGRIKTASLADFEGMSLIAIGTQAKEFGAYASDAKHYAELAEASKDDAVNARDGAIEAKEGAEDAAQVAIDAVEHVPQVVEQVDAAAERAEGYAAAAAQSASEAEQYAQGGLIYRGSLEFENIPVSGMKSGQMYNIENDFTTDERFQEGAGISVKAGTNIAWNGSKWDVLATGDNGCIVVSGTLDKDDWVGNEQEVVALGASVDSAGIIGLPTGASREVIDATVEANISIKLLKKDAIVFKCTNVPDIDIPFCLMITNMPDNTPVTPDVPIGDVAGANIVLDGTSANITWSDPADGEATWAGTKLVRKIDSAPVDIDDGMLVIDSTTRDSYSSTAYVDSNLSYNTTYYYRFFPYTDKNIITTGTAISVTPSQNVISILPSQSVVPEYTGDTITATFAAANHLTVTGNTGVNAGDYTATFTPQEGWKWDPSITEDVFGSVSVSWQIAKASFTSDVVPPADYVYGNRPPYSLSVTNNPGNAQVWYSAQDTISSERISWFEVSDYTFHAGTHYCSAYIEESDNYISYTTPSQPFNVLQNTGYIEMDTGGIGIVGYNPTGSVGVQFSSGGRRPSDLLVSSRDESVATAVWSGSHVEITGHKSGFTIIDVTLPATTDYTSASTTIEVEVEFIYQPDFTWANGTDAQIAEACQRAYDGYVDLSEYWAVGDTRSVSLSAMEATGVGESHVAQTVELVLVDANNSNYEYVTSGTRTYANFIIQQKNGLANNTTAERGYMNSSNTNVGSWNGCARRTWCNSIYKNAIPSSLVDVFKQVKVKTAETYNGSTIQTSQDYFFLPAAKEVFGGTATAAGSDTKYSNLTEFNALSQWKYYETSSNRIKYIGSNNSADYWWERSPCCEGDTSFCYVNSNGTANKYNATGTRLIAPACCI